MYMKPKSKDTLNGDDLDASDKLISMFYGVVAPLMNPLIYSLRNKDVKEAVKNLKKRFLGKWMVNMLDTVGDSRLEF